MKGKNALNFRLLLTICLITVGVEVGLSLWANHVIGQLTDNKQTGISVQLAAKGVMTYVTLLLGSLITTSVSLIFPQSRVFSLYKGIIDERFRMAAAVAVWAYVLVPAFNTAASIIGGYTLLRDAGLSLFDCIACFL